MSEHVWLKGTSQSGNFGSEFTNLGAMIRVNVICTSSRASSTKIIKGVKIPVNFPLLPHNFAHLLLTLPLSITTFKFLQTRQAISALPITTSQLQPSMLTWKYVKSKSNFQHEIQVTNPQRALQIYIKRKSAIREFSLNLILDQSH